MAMNRHGIKSCEDMGRLRCEDKGSRRRAEERSEAVSSGCMAALLSLPCKALEDLSAASRLDESPLVELSAAAMNNGGDPASEMDVEGVEGERG
jgi:hypothetical protein